VWSRGGPGYDIGNGIEPSEQAKQAEGDKAVGDSNNSNGNSNRE
jgi:hypothetical protein